MRYIPSGVLILCLSAAHAHAEPIQWKIADGGNGHFYEHIAVFPWLNWADANEQAQHLSFAGKGGYLMTVTSQAELDFVQANVLSLSYDWVGGFQDLDALDYSEPAGGWRWITGEPFEFTAWSNVAEGGNDDEPNNAGPEHFMSTELSLFNGAIIMRFNDYPESRRNAGFYVEYPVSEPTTLVSASVAVTFALLIWIRTSQRGQRTFPKI
jgi:hypothetical protein